MKTCLKRYINGMGFRGIERVTGVHHTTVINGVKQVGELLPDAYHPEEVPLVGELDELQTFVGSKKNKVWIWTGVDPFKAGILGWVVCDHSAKTFISNAEKLNAIFKISLKNIFLRAVVICSLRCHSLA